MAVKKCAICGNEFVDYGRGKYCKDSHYTTCVICNKQFVYNPLNPKPKTCSPSCRFKLAAKSSFNYKPKYCVVCGEKFIPKSAAQKFCVKHR